MRTSWYASGVLTGSVEGWSSSSSDRRQRTIDIAKALGFATLALAAIVAAGPLAGLAAGVLGRREIPVWAYSSCCVVLLLAATAGALRLEGSRLRDLGLALARARVAELVLGFGVGAALFAILALARGELVDAEWSFSGVRAVPAALAGLVTALLLMLPEELLFRGYALRRLVAALGDWPAILLSAALFSVYHGIGSGMWAIGLFFQMAMPALGGVLFGWAAVRTGGLALPIGLHLGGNWVQSSLVSLRSPYDTMPAAPWTARLTDAQLQALVAPDLGVHLPYIATVLAAALIVRLTARRNRRSPAT